MSETDEVLPHIRRYVELQRSLVDAFKQAYPDVTDWEFLLDAPRRGEVVARNEIWRFQRHGAGLSFQHADGVTVDPHRHVSIPEGFDAWRLLTYIESVGGSPRYATEDQLESVLEALKIAGALVSVADAELYRLVQYGDDGG